MAIDDTRRRGGPENRRQSAVRIGLNPRHMGCRGNKRPIAAGLMDIEMGNGPMKWGESSWENCIIHTQRASG
jgi:hypothetical protein